MKTPVCAPEFFVTYIYYQGKRLTDKAKGAMLAIGSEIQAELSIGNR